MGGQRSCTGFGVHPIRIRPSRTRKRYGAETNSALSLDSSRRCCLRVAGSWFSVSSSTTKPRCRHNLRVTTIVYSKSSYLCAWAACGLFLCAGFYFAVHDSVNPAEQALIFEEEQTLEPRPIGMYSVEIHVRNRSHKLCWILGMEGR